MIAHAAAVSLSAATLVSGGGLGHHGYKLLDPATLSPLAGSPSHVAHAELAPDGRQVAVSRRHTVTFYRARDLRRLRTVRVGRHRPDALNWVSRHRLLVTTSSTPFTVTAVNPVNGRVVHRERVRHLFVNGSAAFDRGELMEVHSNNSEHDSLLVFGVGGRLKHTLALRGTFQSDLHPRPDVQGILVAGLRSILRVDPKTWEVSRHPIDSPIYEWVAPPLGSMLAGYSFSHHAVQIQILDPETLAVSKTVEVPRGGIVQPAGRGFAVYGRHIALKLYGPAGKLRATFKHAHASDAMAVGRFLYTGSEPRPATVRIFDALRHRRLRTIRGHAVLEGPSMGRVVPEFLDNFGSLEE